MDHGLTADQVLASLWRRRTLVFTVAAALFVVSAVFVMSLPSIYQASVVVRVDVNRPNAELVQSAGERVEQRLSTVRQELLARPVLQRAIEEFSLYPALVAKRGVDLAVEQMRKDLDVKLEGETAFEVSYRSRDAETAAKVVNRLPEILAEESIKARSGQAGRATQLFGAEVASLQKQLTDWESKIAQFKIQHAGELPEQLETNMRALERISGQIQSKSEEMRIAEARRSDLVRPRNMMDTEEGRIESAQAALTRELVSARTNWTEDHPEVQRLERELKALRSKRSEGSNRSSPEAQERARVAGTIGSIHGDVSSLRKQAEQFQARLDATPRWAHELSVMNRDYEVAKAKYQSLVSRRVEAELAEQLESKSARSMFNVISPAYTPVSPAKPDRLGGLLLALLGSLGVGVLAAVFKEMRDDSIQDVQQVKERLPVPLLAVIPNLNASLLEARKPSLLPSYTQTAQASRASQAPFDVERVSGLKQ